MESGSDASYRNWVADVSLSTPSFLAAMGFFAESVGFPNFINLSLWKISLYKLGEARIVLVNRKQKGSMTFI
jgi:hypothetical protein